MYLPINAYLQGGKYKIVRFISSGGFGCTYEAEHVMLEKRVAIKEFFVKDFCNRDESTAHVTVGTLSKKGLVEKLRRKFIDEAKALCRLQSPGIVSVQDVFEENGTAYFVMDYVNGKSLSEIVKEQGPLPEERAVRYIRQVAAALQYVHDNNRLHLDIKPGNIMIDGNDNPVLIDFGASKQYDEEDGENTSTLMGKTPGYAPPEQMSNSVVKFLPATDIYALGATLYKLLTGITPLDVNLRISGEELEHLPANISAATKSAVAAAMEINKNKRPQTVTAFIELLKAQPTSAEETIFDAEESSVPKVVAASKPNESTSKQSGKKSKSYIGIIVGVIIVAVLGVGAYWGVNQWREAQWQAEVEERQHLAEEQGRKEAAEQLRLYEEQQKKEAEERLRLAKEQQQKREAAAEQARLAEEQRKKEDAERNRRLNIPDSSITSFETNGKWGFKVSKTGEILVDPKYDEVRSFRDGLAIVRIKGMHGCVDKTGKEVVPLKYNWIESIWSEGLARVCLYSKYGYVDKNGKEVVPLKYDNVASEFGEGLAAVDLNDKMGYIDKTGNVVIPLRYDFAGTFNDGLACIYLNGKMGFIDKTGEVVIPLIYDQLYCEFKGGKAMVSINKGPFFYIDKKGNRVN